MLLPRRLTSAESRSPVSPPGMRQDEADALLARIRNPEVVSITTMTAKVTKLPLASDPSASNAVPRHRRPRKNKSAVALQRHEDDIYKLWDELADFGADATRDALMHCMRRICAMINAQNSYWIGAVRFADGKKAESDALSGWRVRCVDVLNMALTGGPNRLADARRVRNADPGETSRVAIAGAGEFRVYSLGTGIVDLDAFSKTEHYDFFYRQVGITDRIWIVMPVGPQTESYFLFDKHDGRFFTQEELYLAAEALRGIKWFHRQLLLSHGVGMVESRLTPAEHKVVPLILAGLAEKEMAEKLKLKKSTVHQYVTGVYRKFGVRGRTEFMALWLNARL